MSSLPEAHTQRQEGQENDQPRTFWQNFTQQRLKAWQPVLAPKWIITIYIGCGVLFVGLGIILLLTSQSVTEHVVDYTDVELSATGVGKFDIKIDKEMQPPIWIYYQLDGFYQNHRRYVKSRDDDQLQQASDPLNSKLQTSISSNCKPWVDEAHRINYPCGLVARSVFNDSFTLVLSSPNQDDTILAVDSSAKTIAWPADAEGKFRNADPEAVPPGATQQNQIIQNMWVLKTFPPVTCQQTVINPSAGKPFVPVTVATRKERGPGNAQGANSEVEVADCTGYTSGSPRCNFTRAGHAFDCTGDYRPVVNKDWGIENGHFIVWMRVAGLPMFRKLWGKVDRTLAANSSISVYFVDHFPVKPFQGRKALVISTSSALGGRNDFLGYGYIVVGACCLFFGLVFLWRTVRRPRPLGTISLLGPQR